MGANEKVFRHSPWIRAYTFVFAIVLGYGAFLTGMIFLYLVTAYLLFLSLHFAKSSVRVSDQGIITTGLWGTKRMAWSEIGRVTMSSPSIELHHRDENLTMPINGDVKGYTEILEILFIKRPDLTDSQENNLPTHFEFANKFQLGMGIGILLVALSVFSFFILDGYPRIIVSSLAFLFGIGVIASWLVSPQSITLEGSRMLVRYYRREESYSVEDIRSVSLEKQVARYGYLYFVQILLKTGKKLKLTDPELNRMYLSIKRWHERGSKHGDSRPF